ncbi:hypothetical protein KO465_04315 [Candidatus Micrarchaeota archaeon]|nr:hypothetical protein [Candidatus Micrarchaeota archaeon]
MISRKFVVYALLVISIATLMISFYLGGSIPFLFPINLILVILTLTIWKFGYIFTPLFGSFIKSDINMGEYNMLNTLDAIYKKMDDQYYVSKFLTANIHESTTEKTEDEKGLMMEYFERAITSFKYPVKVSLLIRNVDLTKELDELRAERSRLENRKSQLSSGSSQENSSQVSIIERKIAMINKELEKLTSGDKPMEIVSLIMTTSKGGSIDEAKMKAEAQTKEIQAVVGNALSVSVTPLSGDEMLKAFDFQFFIPANASEFNDMFE